MNTDINTGRFDENFDCFDFFLSDLLRFDKIFKQYVSFPVIRFFFTKQKLVKSLKVKTFQNNRRNSRQIAKRQFFAPYLDHSKEIISV